MTVSGTCDPRFAAVRTEFERNFTHRGEVGASVCVTLGGTTVVDLWGGTADRASGRAWERDTVAVVMSSTKGATALCANMLVDRGELDLDAPVSRYWPDFAKGGKESATARMALNHTVGLPHLRTWVPAGGLADWDAHVAMLAAEEAFWEPGTRQGYHALTYGFIVGEVVRRVAGQSPGRFFAEHVAGPLGLDFHIGLPAAEHHRVAPLILADPPGEGEPLPQLMRRILEEPQSNIGLVFLNNGGYMGAFDQPLYYEAEIPAAGGITNARGLAGLYRPLALGGSAGAVTLVSETTATAMGLISAATMVDATLGCRMRFGLGFHKSTDNRTNPQFSEFTTIWSEDAYGHTGNGGSLGFADPRAGMSFAYVMNQMSRTGLPDERSQSLIDATYQALGYRHRDPGVWV